MHVFRPPLRSAAIAIVCGFLLAAPASALTDKDRSEVEAIVKDYLLKNPEILRDALEALEKRQAQEEQGKQRQIIASNAKLIFESPRAPIFGNPQGDVTLV